MRRTTRRSENHGSARVRGRARGAGAFDGRRGLHGHSTANRYHRRYPGHRVIGQSSAPVRLFRQRRVSVLWQHALYTFCALWRARGGFCARENARKIAAERSRAALFANRFAYTRAPTRAARFDIFPLSLRLCARGVWQTPLHGSPRAISNSRVIPNTCECWHTRTYAPTRARIRSCTEYSAMWILPFNLSHV